MTNMRVFDLDGKEITYPLILLVESVEDAIGLHELVCSDGKPHPGLLIIGNSAMDPEKVTQAVQDIFEKHGDSNWTMVPPWGKGPGMPGGFSAS